MWRLPLPLRALALLALAALALAISILVVKPLTMKFYFAPVANAAVPVLVQATGTDVFIRYSTTTSSPHLGTMPKGPVRADCRYKDQRVPKPGTKRSARTWLGLKRGGYVTILYLRFVRGSLSGLRPCTDVPRMTGGAAAETKSLSDPKTGGSKAVP